MTNSNHIQFENWNTEQVIAWLKGLDEIIEEYGYPQHFQNNCIDGKKLLMLTNSDLEKLNVHKLGHQELILEGVDHLQLTRYGHETENLQYLALQLQCKARSLHNLIHGHSGENDRNRANVPQRHRKRNFTVGVLSALADLMSTLKKLVYWMSRDPFEADREICVVRRKIFKIGTDLIISSQESNMSTDSIMKSCHLLAEICDELVMNSKEPLIIQPASLDIVTISRIPEEIEWGFNIRYKPCFGIHCISKIKECSAAEDCGKMELGDQVIQVNYQTVLGWKLQMIVDLLKNSIADDSKEVVVLLKKKPRHISPYGIVGNLIKKRAINNQRFQAATLPKNLKQRRSQEDFTATVPAGRLFVPQTTEERDADDADNEVFRIGSESPQFTLPVGVNPKHRRATVSGGSPTLERPSLIIQDLDPPTRPWSQFVNPAERDLVLSNLSSENRLGVATIWDDKSKELTELTTNEKIENFAKKISLSMNIEDVGSDSPTKEVAVLKISDSPQEESESSSDKSKPSERSQEYKPSERGQEFRVTKPTPHILENPYRDKVNPYSTQKIVLREVATDTCKQNEPMLMKIKRIDSDTTEGMLPDAMKEDIESQKEEKHVGFSTDTKPEEVISYTYIVVGGVVQKIPVDQTIPSTSESPTVRRRNKPGVKRLDRRVSCKDLGKGDCEGWLYKRKMNPRGPLAKNWAKRWCILKNSNLFYYREKDSLKAEGVIHLPAFQVSPAPDIRTKKFAFKVHNTGTAFCFGSERQDDMSKWMNKMGLAAINFDLSQAITTGGFIKPESKSQQAMGVQNMYYSESEDESEDGRQYGSLRSLSSMSSVENNNSLSPTSRTDLSASTSTLVSQNSEVQMRRETVKTGAEQGSHDDLAGILRTIEQQHLTIDGIDRDQLRRSRITSLGATGDSRQLDKLRRLQSLKRTLKAKEMELSSIESCLQNPSQDALHDYHDMHEQNPECFGESV